jgi:hypothetical protein
VRPRFPAGKHGRTIRLNGNSPESLLARLDNFGHSGKGPARTYSGNENIHSALRVLPDFLCLRPAVNLRVGPIVELLENDAVWNLARQFLRLPLLVFFQRMVDIVQYIIDAFQAG